MQPSESLEREIEWALGADGPVYAPAGFAERVGDRLFYCALQERLRRRRRLAAGLGSASAGLVVIVTALFVQMVDVPAWVVENVPGVLGRLDGARVGLERSPQRVLAALGAGLLTAGGVLSAALRPRKN